MKFSKRVLLWGTFGLSLFNYTQAAPPEITSTAPTAIDLGQSYSYQVSATDPEADPLTFELAIAPSGMTISSTGLITWTPGVNDAGITAFKINVHDQEDLSVSQYVDLTVIDPNNNAPIINQEPPGEVIIGNTYSYDLQATDSDGDTLIYRVWSWPELSGLSVSSNGVVTWAPTNRDAAGEYWVTVEADDNHLGIATREFYLTAIDSTNRVPVIGGTPVLNAPVNQVYTFDLQASDADGDALTYSLGTWPQNNGAQISTDGIITWTPGSGDIGEAVMMINVFDGHLGEASLVYKLDVSVGTNQNPVITSAPTTQATVGAAYTYALLANDPDGDPLTYSLLTSPTSMTIDQATGVINWQPSATSVGETVTVEVADNQGGAVTQSFILVVNDSGSSNVAPVITSAAITSGSEGGLYSYAVEASDANGDTLSYELLTQPLGMTIDAQTGLIQWTPDFDQADTHAVTVSVSDPGGLNATQSFNVVIDNTNRLPVITSTPALSIEADTAYSYQLIALDPDSDLLSYSLLSGPAGMTVSSLGLVSWPGASSGAYSVNLGVSDATGTTNQSFILSIAAANQAPTINALTPDNGAIFDEGSTVQLTADVLDDRDGVLSGPSLTWLSNIDGPLGTGSPLTVNLSRGSHSITLTATDSLGLESSRMVGIAIEEPLPPNPADVAPTLDTTGLSSMYERVSFLFDSLDPIQREQQLGSIDPDRVAVLSGQVLDRANNPLPRVRISVQGHPEYGYTLSRADGMFDLAVNAGGVAIINYERAGYIPAQQRLEPFAHDYYRAGDQVLIPYDAQSSSIELSSNTLQVARGGIVTDDDGSRQATILFPPATTATMQFADGSEQSLSSLTVRATEFTVGANGPETMPGALPIATAYTYAVELSVDEAVAAGAQKVQFSQSLPFYVENFLGFPTGTVVPVGSYSYLLSSWVPEPNGRVIEILSIDNGAAIVDVLGEGNPATQSELDELGITPDELNQLATLYLPGQQLWRAPVTHFTPWDLNWPYGLPNDAEPPPEQLPNYDDLKVDFSALCKGCVIEAEHQNLGKELPVDGTSFSLNYRSDRQSGFVQKTRRDIQISGLTVPDSLSSIELQVDIAGHQHFYTFPAEPNQTFTFEWDGSDVWGRSVIGAQPIRFTLHYVYPAVFKGSSASGGGGGGGRRAPPFSFSRFITNDALSLSGDRQRYLIRHTRVWHDRIESPNHITQSSNLGNWTLSSHHRYDPVSQVLYFGDGSQLATTTLGDVLERVAGNGECCSVTFGGQALEMPWSFVSDVAIAPNGDIYVAFGLSDQIIRIDSAGTVQHVAGTGNSGYSQDGILATQADLENVRGLAFSPAGELHLIDDYRIRKIDTNGIITTVAGDGRAPEGLFGGQGRGQRLNNVPATQSSLARPEEIAFDQEGNLYMAESSSVGGLRRVDTGGIIGAVVPFDEGPQCFIAAVGVSPQGEVYYACNEAVIYKILGDGSVEKVAGIEFTPSYSGDGGFAIFAGIMGVNDLEFLPDGSLVFSEENRGSGEGRIRRVSSGGIITTLAGTADNDITAYDNFNALVTGNVSATRQSFTRMRGAAVDSLGNIVLAASQTSGSIMARIRPQFGGQGIVAATIPARDGSVLYQFDERGRHLSTTDAVTGVDLLIFNYIDGVLSSITDVDGDTTEIGRDSNNQLTSISSADGQVTAISLSAAGEIESLETASNEIHQMDYHSGGLLHRYTSPENQTTTFSFTSDGRLETDVNAGDGGWNISRQTYDLGRRSSGLPATAPGEGRFVSEETGGYLTTFDSAEGRTNTFKVDFFTDGSYRQIQQQPSGARRITFKESNGNQDILLPDGMRLRSTEAPDPRFGMLAPVVDSLSISTPGGIIQTITKSRSADLSDDNDPFSFEVLSETTIVNGREYNSRYTAATRTWLTTTPENRTSTSVTDTEGRPVQEQVAGFTPVNTVYDSRGRVEEVVQGDRRTRYTYYNSGPQAGYLETVTDALDRTTRYEYDGSGRVIRQEFPDGVRVLGYSYDDNGNLSNVTTPSGEVHRYGYNDFDLDSLYTPPSVSGITAPETRFSYDRDQLLTQTQLPDGRAVDFDFNLVTGQLRRVTIPRGSYNYVYNSNRQIGSISSPDGSTLRYEYDGSLRTQVRWQGIINGQVDYNYTNDYVLGSYQIAGTSAIAFDYDNDNLLTQVGGLLLARDSASGLLEGTTLNNITTQIGYNNFAELETYAANHNSNALYNVNYTRDAIGRIEQQVETIGGVTRTLDYDYDLTGQLTTVRTNGVVSESYDYDLNGNRSIAGETTTYDEQDRLLSKGATTFTYDASGMLETRTIGSDITTYDYDALNNLKQVNLPNGDTIDYFVDGENRRIGKRVNGVFTERWLYSGKLNPVAELNGDGSIRSQFIYGDKANVPAYMIRDGVTYRIISDHLGSPRLVINSSTGDIVQRIDYDTWGNITSDTNPGFQPFAFAGGLYDQDTGLVRFGVRDYDPSTGRFTTKDPIGLDGGLNVYGYAGNDPVNYIDPTGYCFIKAVAEFLASFLPGMGIVEGIEAIENGEYFMAALLIASDVPIPAMKALKGLAVGIRAFRSFNFSSAARVCCFVAGTQVTTKEGYRNIEDLEIGDLVLAKNEETGEQDWKPVSHLFTKYRQIYELTVVTPDGQEELIKTTDDHPFYTVDRGWIAAAHLKSGDKIESSKLGAVTVQSLLTRNEYDTTYNIEVADFHTYYVTEFDLLVHNVCVTKKGKWDTPENHSRNIANDILKEKKLSGSGTGARSGQHGTPYNQAARELQKLAKEAEKRGDLPEGVQVLRDKANEFLQRAKELNHKM